MQGTVATFDPQTRSGRLVTDDGAPLTFGADALAEHIRHLRPGQRVHVEGGDDQEVTGVRLW